jgi:hypothetical protein
LLILMNRVRGPIGLGLGLSIAAWISKPLASRVYSGNQVPADLIFGVLFHWRNGLFRIRFNRCEKPSKALGFALARRVHSEVNV